MGERGKYKVEQGGRKRSLPPFRKKEFSMIFPHDVHKRMNDQKSLTGQNKVQLFVVLFLVGNVLVFFALQAFVAGYFANGFVVCILIQVVLCSVIGVFVFRFVIFDENAKKQEYKGYENDSFAKYMLLRKDAQTVVEAAGVPVYLFEYTDGCATCTLEFKFGNNTMEKAESTRKAYESILQAIANFNFESRQIVMPEDFRVSKEFQEHIRLINSMKSKSLANVIMSINDAIISESSARCNIDVMYLMIKTTGNYQKSDLRELVKQITEILRTNVTAFRSVTFLELDQLLELYRVFYGVAAIDLSMMKTIELAKDLSDEFLDVVELFSLHSASGKTYNVKTDDYFKTSERECKV